jgi:ArsR family transcriptional regulator
MEDNKLSLAQEINQLHANICSAISEPHRILLLYAIAEQARNVNSLAEEVEISQSAASRHLKVLKMRGLIQARREGTSVIYSLTDQRLIQALDLLREVMLDQLAHRADLLKANQNLKKGTS